MCRKGSIHAYIYIYIYIYVLPSQGVEYCCEGINGCHPCNNAKLFKRIEHSDIQLRKM